jgi:hypothetical protein
MPNSADGVFINVPFDRRYKKLFDALVFAVQDIRAHYNDVSLAIGAVRDWLRSSRANSRIPGAGRMRERYIEFRLDLPAVARAANLAVNELNFLDYRTLVTGWLDENSW